VWKSDGLSSGLIQPDWLAPQRVDSRETRDPLDSDAFTRLSFVKMLNWKSVSALVQGLFVCLLAARPLLASAAQFVPPDKTIPKIALASNEGELAIKKFVVAPGFKVDLWAAEPLLANPVAICTDEKGRWYVAETFRLHAGVTDIRGHMDWLNEELASQTVAERDAYMTRHEGKRIADYYKESDRVRLLVDTDGDGKADKATVFADGFNHLHDGIGAGLLARGGKVWYTCIPDLYLLEDTKNTGTADVKKSLQTGYGIRTGFLGHDLHGLRMGPDGRLYFSIGDRAFNVKNGTNVVKETEMGAVLRCNPDGSQLEIFARGLRNPQELAFDRFGNLFTGDNNSDGGDPARWVYVVEGGDNGWRVGFQFINSPNSRGVWLSERLCYPQFESQAAFIIPPIALIANGPSGLTYYPGTGFPARYDQHFFLCDFRGGSGSGVHSFAMKAKGAGFEMIDRSQFLWEILCTDAEFGIDGGLYVSDWVAGWNKTGKGRIYRVHDPAVETTPIVLETKELISGGMAQHSVDELAVLLAHPDMRVRQEAQFALVDKNALAKLTEIAQKDSNQLARMHAVWGLGQIARKSNAPVAVLLGLLSDPDAEIRAQSAKVLGDAKATKAEVALIKMLADGSPRPRFFAAMALGKIGGPETIESLSELLRSNADKDVYLRHAGVMGLLGAIRSAAPAKQVELLGSVAKDASPSVRMGALLAMRRLQQPEIAGFLDDSEPRLVVEAARAINDASIDSAMPQLATLISQAPRFAAWPTGTPEQPGPRDALFRRTINANFRLGTSASATALSEFAANPKLPESFRTEALALLGEWATPSGRDRITGLWRPLPSRDPMLAARAAQPVVSVLLRSGSNPIKIAAARTAALLGIKAVSPELFALATNDTQSASVRIESLKALAALKDRQTSDAVKIALASNNESLRNEATKIQAQLKPKDATAQMRVILEKGSFTEKQNAFTTLASMQGPAPDEILSQWMDKLIAGQVAPELRLDLLDAAGKRSSSALKDKIRKYEESRDPKDDLRAFRECLTGGNAKDGRTIFMEKAEVSCVRCHKVGDEGGEVGPNLAGLGTRQSREYILESITFPNKQIAKGFETLLVSMKDGTTYAGILKSENDTILEINSPEDGILKLRKADIEKRDRGLSSMPEELRQVLTKQEVRNLVEFLATAK